jgi:F420-dependent oxidoreductase-like protein
MQMRFSCLITPWTTDFTEVLRIARHAADTGWDGIWVTDHFMPHDGGMVPPETPVLEAGSTVAALAATVPRVRIGTLVHGNTYRHPALLAKMAATADRISGGRITLGLGTGWQANEHQQYGIPFPSVTERIDRLDEAIQVIRGLLTEPLTSFDGQYYRLLDAVCEPKPVQRRLPLLVAANGEQRMLPLVARHADQWNCIGGPDVFRHKAAVLDRHCEAIGRDPATIHRTAQAVLLPTPELISFTDPSSSSPMPIIGGPPEHLAALVADYAAAGVDELTVPFSALTMGGADGVVDMMDRLMAEVLTAHR